MVILRDKIRFYEGVTDGTKAVWRFKEGQAYACFGCAGQKLLDSLAETWDFFFCDVLSMLQAIFHPVQVCDRKIEVFLF